MSGLDVEALSARVAHATHALLTATREVGMPATAAEVCVYDANWEALTVRHTTAALREAERKGLAGHTRRGFWIASNFALDHRAAFEARFLRDDARENP